MFYFKMLIFILLLLLIISITTSLYITGGNTNKNILVLYLHKQFNIPEEIIINNYSENIYDLLNAIKPYANINNYYYSENLSYKVDRIKYILKDIPVKSILDVGTESPKFLDLLQEKFPGVKVNGLNIKNFNHYESFTQDKRIIIYDNYVPQKATVITLLSVLHHIPDIDKKHNLKWYIQQYCKNAKYILIKENNLINKTSRNMYDLQHIAFEEVFTHTPSKNFRRYDITEKYLTQLMNKNNFKRVYLKKKDVFTGTYWALYKKNKIDF